MSDSKRVRISKREGALMARLSAKEQEVYEAQACARDLYRARRPVTDFARHVYTDPAINVEFQLMTAQLAEMEDTLRLREAELKELKALTAKKESEDKAAKKVKSESGTGSSAAGGEAETGEKTGAVEQAQGLVLRCQQLEQENEELAAAAGTAKVAQLQSERAVAEAYAGELKAALEEAYEYIEQLEEEREVNAHKVYALEQAVRSAAEEAFERDRDWEQGVEAAEAEARAAKAEEAAMSSSAGGGGEGEGEEHIDRKVPEGQQPAEVSKEMGGGSSWQGGSGEALSRGEGLGSYREEEDETMGEATGGRDGGEGGADELGQDGMEVAGAEEVDDDGDGLYDDV